MQNTGKFIDVLLASCSCFSSRLFRVECLVTTKTEDAYLNLGGSRYLLGCLNLCLALPVIPRLPSFTSASASGTAAATLVYGSCPQDFAFEIGVCTSLTFPFTFYDAKGQPINGVPDANGICAFPDSRCGVNAINTGGRVGNCCSAAPESVVTGGNYMFVAFAFIFIPIFFIRKYMYEVWQKHPILEETIGDGENRTPRWIKTYLLEALIKDLEMWNLGWCFCCNRSSHSNVAFYPTKFGRFKQERKCFKLKDIVNVKINYALNSGVFEAVNSLLHLGIAGTGVLVSEIASILGAIPSVLLALTNPGLDTDIELYKGCNIIAAGLDVHDITFTYWLIQV
eukprot:scaffold246_cov181-Skeletonema_marinoi.AAC.5